jgi:catechol 2,3-dioxygenase-like lactoylglutathione lyase family enzyme
MFSVVQEFHVTHAVDDIEAAVAWYDDVFSPVVWQRTDLWGTQLALLAIGDFVLMPMQPPDNPDVSTRRFLERNGAHLHSLALYVDDPVDMMEHLGSLGFRLTGARGGDPESPSDEIWTQPRETPVVLELFQPNERMNDPRHEAAWSSSYWRDEHPLAIRDAVYTVVTDDLAGATKFFVDAMHGTVTAAEADTPYATRSTFVALGDNVTIEVAKPSDPASRAGRDLAARTSFHAVTFQVADLARAVAHLEAKGIRSEPVADGHVVLDPADTLEVQFRLTDHTVGEW